MGSKHVITAEPDWQAAEWTHVAVTWQRVKWEMDMLLYVNGERYDFMQGKGRGVFPDSLASDQLNIGSFGTSLGGSGRTY